MGDRERERQSYYVGVGRDACHQKGSDFHSMSSMGYIFHCTNSGKGFKYTCLEMGPCLSEKGLLSYPCLELENNK